ncbi:oligosaccharide flippase family protein [Paenibacillus sp. GCM10023248]|uniref:oligosaccharide flippase family protein n=1 Tax=unclassified Paenibacillus TaxID=185978 RepID=UPI0023783124|nr:oligosaccharide flippase family protein [Paenibacillus sp. MAHUQ-63]MDD9266525.1 oligosaccharide flippase family protein [Paenibacillus sp. MAHUQ-63]
MKNQLKAGAVLSYVALFINSAISILYTPIMLHQLGQSEYGLYSLATSIMAYLGVLDFGLGSAVIRYTAKYKALNEQEKCSNLYGMFCVMYGVLGFIALICGCILIFTSHHIFSNSITTSDIQALKIMMTIMVVNLSTSVGLGLFSVLILAHERFIVQKVIGIVSSVISPLIMLPLLFMGYGSISMVIVTTSLNLLTIFINMYFCFRVLKIKIVLKKFDLSLFKEILLFSSLIFLNLLIDKIYWSTDQVILGIYSGTIAVSIYTIGASFSGYFSAFSSAISNVFLSKVTGMVTKEVPDREISDLFIRIGRVQYIVISFALSGFIAFGQEFINLWVGTSYSSSYLIALLILIPMIIPLIQGMGGIILQAKNMQKFKSFVYIAIALANVLLSILFVQWWGAVGCALATAIAFTTGNIIIMNIYYWRRIKIDIPKFWRNILGMSVPLLSSLIFGITLNKYIHADNWIFFLFKISIFSILYMALMWFVAMNKYEKNLFKDPTKNLINRFRKRKLVESQKVEIL